MSVPLRTMLKITDCIEHKVKLAGGDLLNTPQYYMDDCLNAYPHVYVFYFFIGRGFWETGQGVGLNNVQSQNCRSNKSL